MSRAALLHASHCGRPVEVGVATDAEVAALQAPVSVKARDMLERWTLIAIRNVSFNGVELHALGWRRGLQNSWITSALTIVDLPARLVATRSGNAYGLAEADVEGLSPELAEHLAYALSMWGFSDVRV
ncbi:hypothetical protein [Acidisphaera sp. L21]|jgi:hypothetical protein|uniref:hypothetical protein n=1 Tax=Acidisphaera sp. L21 TaxID=1641851 RepID=UPI00131C9D2D|nr:hypothetical protein [Acidisphaera sp. L21]